VKLEAHTRTRLIELALAAVPEEACGIFAYEDGEIFAVMPCRNVAPNPLQQFEMHPLDLIEANRDLEAMGFFKVGVYHSHVLRDAEPSEMDIKLARPDMMQLIVGLHGGGQEPDIKLYQPTADKFDEVELA
jgi:proteasome lid subunit RPN8/RPN11